MFYAENISHSKKRAIDIGANIGIYSYFFSKKFESVEAFEPQSTCAETLLDYTLRRKNIHVHCNALSDENSVLPLYVPLKGDKVVSELATLNYTDNIQGDQCVKVATRKLDDYQFKEVSLIKIDVEGHESNVIRGAKETILTCKPILLVEIEQRHIGTKPIEIIFQQVLDLGYVGYFFLNGKRFPISDFVYELHQKPYLSGQNFTELHEDYPVGYVNNFIFTPI